MHFYKNKTATITLALLLTISMTASIILISPVNAHVPSWSIQTYAYISAAPNPVGVNQQTIVVFWLNTVFDSATLANDYRFHNYQLIITAPDGKTTSQNFSTVTDPTSSQFTYFTPTQVGTYTLNFTFPGQAINAYSHANDAYVNDTYLPSSASITLTVQETPLPAPVTSGPMPSQYWTHPIYGQNTDWWSISSNWLGMGAPGYFGFVSPDANQQSYPGDAVGPQTSHIMWTTPLQAGGVAGGNNFAIPGDTYFEGSAYNQRFANPIILNGKLYYTEPVGVTGAPNSAFSFGPTAYGPTVCVDLATGKTLWSRTDVPALSFGYIYAQNNPNQHGVWPPILFTTNFGEAFDADTGNWMFNVTNVPSASAATEVMGPQGEQLRYVFSNSGNATNPNWTLGEWNSTKLWQFTGATSSPALSGMVNTPTGTAVDAGISNPNNPNCRYDWNVSVSWVNSMPTPPPGPFGPSSPFTVIASFYNDMMICYNGTLPGTAVSISGANPISEAPYTYFAVNLNASKGAVGSVLWWNTINAPPGNLTILPGAAEPTADNGQGVFVEGYRETMQWVGYSMATGQKLWGPTPSQTAFDYYGNTGVSFIQGVAAYGNLYSSQYGGIVYCYDMTNGNLLWTYGNGGEGNSTFSGFYTAYNHYPTFIAAIGNGVVYTVTSEHTATAPIYQGALARAINATSGQEIWTLSDYTSILAGPFSSPSSYAVADGFATFFNGYDNQIYCVGRGPSTTTVQAPLTALTLGGTAVIQGTVMDISSGTTQAQQAADFPNGVPCASDSIMSSWMSYVYQQQAAPTNFKGVQVHLTALDPNGNIEQIGTVTTDQNGLFSAMFTPPVPGVYKIIATFDGSNAYWGSNAETTIGVVSSSGSASPVPVPTQTPLPSTPTSSVLPTSTPAPTTSTSPSPAPAPSESTNNQIYILVAAAIVIIIVAVAAAVVLLKRRK